MKKNLVELLGAFWLIFCGCGNLFLVAASSKIKMSHTRVLLIFGLSKVSYAYNTIDSIATYNINPSVSFFMDSIVKSKLKKAFTFYSLTTYGVVVTIITLVGTIKLGNSYAEYAGLRSIGYFSNSHEKYNTLISLIAEYKLIFLSSFVVLSIVGARYFNQFATMVVGNTISELHLVSIPITNTCKNPTKSNGQAHFAFFSYPQKQLRWFRWAPLNAGKSSIDFKTLYPLRNT